MTIKNIGETFENVYEDDSNLINVWLCQNCRQRWVSNKIPKKCPYCGGEE